MRTHVEPPFRHNHGELRDLRCIFIIGCLCDLLSFFVCVGDHHIDHGVHVEWGHLGRLRGLIVVLVRFPRVDRVLDVDLVLFLSILFGSSLQHELESVSVPNERDWTR